MADMKLDIAARRVAALASEDDRLSRRDTLRADLDARGLSAVATAELRLLEEECAAIEGAAGRAVCACCGSEWPCPMAGLYPHRKEG